MIIELIAAAVLMAMPTEPYPVYHSARGWTTWSDSIRSWAVMDGSGIPGVFGGPEYFKAKDLEAPPCLLEIHGEVEEPRIFTIPDGAGTDSSFYYTKEEGTGWWYSRQEEAEAAFARRTKDFEKALGK
jgi:hypothetical protein